MNVASQYWVGGISAVTLIRPNTTLDQCKKAEEAGLMQCVGQATYYVQAAACAAVRRWLRK